MTDPLPASAQAPAELVRDAVLAVPGVAALHAGPFGEIGTYLPGRRVGGIRLTPELAQVHVALHQGAPIRETAGLIRRSVAALVATPVDVAVEDVVA